MLQNSGWVVGVDYSMTCPAITFIHSDQSLNFETCCVHYLSEKAVKPILLNVHGTRLASYQHNEQRFDWISEWAINAIKTVTCARVRGVYIEDYSFGSKGKTFHIAENVGLFKHKLWKNSYPITLIPPTVIKKFATGKGNSNKDDMLASFKCETNVDLMKLYQPKAKNVGSPVGDIVDSYYIAKMGHH